MLIRNTIIYVLLDILSKASALIILPLVTKSLSVEDYGTYKFIMEMSILSVMLSTFGLGSSIARFNFDSINIKRIYTLGYFTSFLSIPLGLCLLFFVSYKYSIDLFIGIMFVMIVLLTIFNSYTRLYFTINKKIKEFSIVKVFELLSFFLSITFFYNSGFLNIYTLLVSMLIMGGVNTVFSYFHAREIINVLYLKSCYLVFNKIKRFSLDSYFSGMIKYINLNMEKFFFAFYLNTTQFGIYALAVTVGAIVRTFGTALFLSFAPVYYENHNKGEVFKNVKIYKILFILAPIFYYLFLQIVSVSWDYIVDSSYFESYKYVSVISLIYVLEIYYGLAQYYWMQMKNTKFLLKFETILLIIYTVTFSLICFLPRIKLMMVLYILVFISLFKLLVFIFSSKRHEMREILWWVLISLLIMGLIAIGINYHKGF